MEARRRLDISSAARKREIVQLLRDYRTFQTAFGGARPLDETGVKDASYGPAGLIQAGTAFDREDRKLLAESFGHLRNALVLLQRDDFSAWASLVEPYLGDPADSGIVAHWRESLRELDKENAERKKAEKQPRVALVTTRLLLERHDRAVAKIAEYLEDVDLYAIFARPMSEEEEKKGEDQNAEMLAVFNRLRASGLKRGEARDQTAENFGVHPDTVDRVLEFRGDIKPDECVWGGCEKAPFSQNLCVAHYNKKRRAEKKGGK